MRLVIDGLCTETIDLATYEEALTMASECSKVYEHWKEICRREEPEGTSKSRFYDYLKDSGKYSKTTTDFFGQLKSNIKIILSFGKR